MTGENVRICPDCGSDNVELTQRGYAGRTDERHQFFRCLECSRVTYEILSRNARELRLEKVAVGDVIEEGGNPYRVMRVLKIGLDEHLIYVRADNNAKRGRRPRREDR
ncbi:MAG: hypothetical protein WD401_02705 [Thermomicrobiaceae bacterium]